MTWNLVLNEFEPTVDEARGISSREGALETVKAVIKERGLGKSRVGVEGRCPVFLYREIQEAFPGMSLKVADGIFLDLRKIKSDDEVRRIEKSSRITSEVITELFEGLRPGMTDKDLITSAKKSMLDRGAAGWDHMSLSAGGGTGLFPFRGKKIKRGDLVGTDLGAIFEGYSSDMNRLCVLGRPASELSDFYQDIIDIENSSVKKLKPGNDVRDVYQSAMDGFQEKKLDPATNLFGHSIGIQVEESPLIREGSQMKLEGGMVMNFEIYCKTNEGQFVGIEDTFLLTNSGNKRLTTAGRRLFEA